MCGLSTTPQKNVDLLCLCLNALHSTLPKSATHLKDWLKHLLSPEVFSGTLRELCFLPPLHSQNAKSTLIVCHLHASFYSGHVCPVPYSLWSLEAS